MNNVGLRYTIFMIVVSALAATVIIGKDILSELTLIILLLILCGLGETLGIWSLISISLDIRRHRNDQGHFLD